MLDRCDEVISEQLTPLQRRIFHLKHLRRQPIRAIAETLGKSEDAIKANLYRMRRALADGAPGLEAFLATRRASGLAISLPVRRRRAADGPREPFRGRAATVRWSPAAASGVMPDRRIQEDSRFV